MGRQLRYRPDSDPCATLLGCLATALVSSVSYTYLTVIVEEESILQVPVSSRDIVL
jgi:hypothetical protein